MYQYNSSRMHILDNIIIHTASSSDLQSVVLVNGYTKKDNIFQPSKHICHIPWMHIRVLQTTENNTKVSYSLTKKSTHILSSSLLVSVLPLTTVFIVLQLTVKKHQQWAVPSGCILMLPNFAANCIIWTIKGVQRLELAI